MSDVKPDATDKGELDKPDATDKGDKKDVQIAINAIIKREREDAAKERQKLETDLAATQERLKALEASSGKKDEAYADTVRKPLLEELETVKAREGKRAEKLKRAEVARFAKGLAVEGAEGDVADAILPDLSLSDAEAVEVMETVDGTLRRRYGKAGPMSVEERVREYLAAKPWLAAPSVRPGLGINDAARNTSNATAGEDGLRQKIADAEAKKDWVVAGRLKSELVDLKRKK